MPGPGPRSLPAPHIMLPTSNDLSFQLPKPFQTRLRAHLLQVLPLTALGRHFAPLLPTLALMIHPIHMLVKHSRPQDIFFQYWL